MDRNFRDRSLKDSSSMGQLKAKSGGRWQNYAFIFRPWNPNLRTGFLGLAESVRPGPELIFGRNDIPIRLIQNRRQATDKVRGIHWLAGSKAKRGQV
jgi:hypothetical protein